MDEETKATLISWAGQAVMQNVHRMKMLGVPKVYIMSIVTQAIDVDLHLITKGSMEDLKNLEKQEGH